RQGGDVGVVVLDRVLHQRARAIGPARRGVALEAPEADVRVAEPDEHARARRRRLVVALQALPGLDEAEGARGLHAARLEQLAREELADATLERQPPVSAARVERLPAAL